MEGVRWGFFSKMGVAGDESTREGSRGKAPAEGLGDKVPQKLKQNVKLVYNFHYHHHHHHHFFARKIQSKISI